MTLSRNLRLLGAIALSSLAACGDSKSTTASSTGTLSVRLTDAPVDNVQSAQVWISKVYLIGGADTVSSRITISSTPQQFDLLTLQNGVTAALGSAVIPVGTYTQMRFVVDSAKVTLKAPLTFSDGSASKTLVVPSGMQTGVKINFQSAVQVTPGETILVVDFDVSRSFVFTGVKTAPNGALFKPVLNATVQNVAASIAGVVAPASSKAALAAVAASGDTVATTMADTLTGAYKLRFLAPGTYTVKVLGTATGSTLVGSKSVAVRAAQDTTGVNFP